MTGLRHDGMGERYGGALDSYFQDVRRRLREMGLTMMGGTYALGLADLYRRGGRPSLASALLRHAMSLINPTIQSAEYAPATTNGSPC
jgi:hypothetical protein